MIARSLLRRGLHVDQIQTGNASADQVKAGNVGAGSGGWENAGIFHDCELVLVVLSCSQRSCGGKP